MSFRLGSIPVRVRAPFLFIALLFASSLRRPEHVLVGAIVVFVSVLVHELGHALVGRMFGLTPQIELHGMGGTTSWIAGRDVGHFRGLLISLAGPFAGFALFGAVLVVGLLGITPKHALAQLAVELLLYVNLRWGILNLVPLLPLDGGNVMRSVLMIVTKGRGEKPARAISVLTGGLFILYGATREPASLWLVLLGAMFTYTNVQAFVQADQRAIDAPLARAIELAYVAIDKQDGAAAVEILRPVLHDKAAPELRQLGVRLLAYGLLLQEKWGELLDVIDVERASIGAEELERYAKAARGVGREVDAVRIDAIRGTLSAA